MEKPIPTIYDATLGDLEAFILSWGLPAFRARQIYRQLYFSLITDPQAMTDLPVALRQRLAAEIPIGHMTLEHVKMTDEGVTRKALFRLPTGEVVETVLMLYPDRATACVSTQAGCAMGCVFCATGLLGLQRNLTTGEMIEQVIWATRELRTVAAEKGFSDNPATLKLSNLVFMGMGEPFANYDSWWAAVERLHDPQGYNLGARSMTVSTVGLVPGIRRLAQEQLPINLAISLHAPDDELRSSLVPINQRYPIAELLSAARAYTVTTGRRVSFEYVLLEGRNDRPEQAMALARILRRNPPILCHVNLIPWNPVPGMRLDRSRRRYVLDFQQILLDAGVACTVRVERGLDIAAACGQLAGAV